MAIQFSGFTKPNERDIFSKPDAIGKAQGGASDAVTGDMLPGQDTKGDFKAESPLDKFAGLFDKNKPNKKVGEAFDKDNPTNNNKAVVPDLNDKGVNIAESSALNTRTKNSFDFVA